MNWVNLCVETWLGKFSYIEEKQPGFILYILSGTYVPPLHSFLCGAFAVLSTVLDSFTPTLPDSKMGVFHAFTDQSAGSTSWASVLGDGQATSLLHTLHQNKLQVNEDLNVNEEITEY